MSFISVIFFQKFLQTLVLFDTLCILTINANQLPGHLQPLGSHRPPMHVDIRDSSLNPIEFFDAFVKPSKPVLLKGAAKSFPSFMLWKNDSYLKEKHGEWQIQAEYGKKETRKGDGLITSFRNFLDIYNKSDIYLVHDIYPNNTMAEDVFLPKCLLCGGFADSVITSVMWFSSGGTKSVLHNDDLDNINCLYDGNKELVMIDKKHRALVPIDRPEKGYSTVDVERVDMTKYPTLSQVPWYEAKMEAGDCFYIPYKWYHHVKSSPTRNLAINVWFQYLIDLTNRDECVKQLPNLPNYRPLSTITLGSEDIRSKFLELFVTLDQFSLQEFFEIMSDAFDVDFSETGWAEDLTGFFHDWDQNNDGVVTFSEGRAISNEKISKFFTLTDILEDKIPETDAQPKSNAIPRGHMQPLGSNMSPLPVEVRNNWPDPIEFFEKYSREGKPVLFRGLAKEFPSYQNLRNDSYLKQQFGTWKIEAEEGKKENRSKGVFDMTFAKFLDTYQYSDVYLVEDILLSNKLAESVFLPKPLLCGGFTKVINTAVMWFSSGSTKSVLHNDAFDNLNCLFDGSKQLILIDKMHSALVPIDNPEGGYSSVDVDKVDMYKYPTLQKLPWYNVTMHAGDCLFIPLYWYHQVNSLPTRNLAINVWWNHLYEMQLENCPSDMANLSNYSKLSNYEPNPKMEEYRDYFLSLFDESTGTGTLEELQASNWIPTNILQRFFSEADRNRDGVLTYKEVYALPQESFRAFQVGYKDDDVTHGDDVAVEDAQKKDEL